MTNQVGGPVVAANQPPTPPVQQRPSLRHVLPALGSTAGAVPTLTLRISPPGGGKAETVAPAIRRGEVRSPGREPDRPDWQRAPGRNPGR